MADTEPTLDEETVEIEASSAKPKGDTSRRLTSEEWREVKRLYEEGDRSIKSLSEQFKISVTGLSQRFKNNGIKRGSRRNEIEEAERKAQLEAAAKMAESYAAKRGQLIEEYRLNGINALKRVQLLAHKVVADALKASQPVSSTEDDLKAIQRYNKIVVDNLEGQKSILDPEGFTELTLFDKLEVVDLTDEDILNHRIGIGAISENATVKEMHEEDRAIEESMEND